MKSAYNHLSAITSASLKNRTMKHNEFEERVEFLSQKGLSKPDRIKAVIDRKIGKISKREIMEACPDISKVTAERTLTALVKSGYLWKISGGRTTAYAKTDKQC